MLRQELLTTRGGGILADDMGLGKTIQALALILANPPAPSSKAKTTLVVCPLGVLNQWYTEIREKTFKGTLRVGVHHPTVGQKLSPGQMTSLYDVVLTTFDMVTRESPHPRKSAKPAAGAGPAKKATRKEQPANESGPLFRVEFHRIVLDESHWVKNPAAERTRAVLELQGRHRWCLSGTPLQNSVSDLYPPFRFLGVPDFPTKEAFDRSIASLLPTRRSAEAMTRLHGVLRDYCLRRRKTDLSPLGKPLLDLPGRTVVLDSEAKFSEDERRFYNAIARNTRRMFARLMKRGTVMRNWSNVLVRILRERQAADDYRIIRAHFTKKDLGDEGLSYDELLAKIFGDVTEQDRTRELERARKLFPKAVFEGLVRAGKEAERSEAGGKNRFADTCPICRDQCEAATVVRCGHVFCRDCITNYANDESNKDSGCPVCSFTPIKANELVSAEAFYVAPAVPADADSTQAALDEEERKQDQQDEAAIRKVLQEGPQCGAKILRLLQLLRAQQESKPGSKAIVFSSFTSMLDLCGKALKDAGIGFARYDGEMTPEQRNSAIRSLNSDPRTLVLLVSLKAGGVGLNLTAASRAYLVDVWYNPAAEEQAIDRIHRIGQREDVLVTRITITGTIEDTIYRLQERKSRLARGTLGDDRGTGGESNRLTLRDLIELFGGSVAL
ncbi:SNF2 family N-terminal domain-containing protein [Hyaloraphidium curvatum]|nr:SNF2 family N-terminal domain-containing protein [Hyaloraphidium curvatum]